VSEITGPDSFSTLKEVIDRLRSPGGCPWDRKQTHDSLKPYLVEECYEVLQALEKGTPDKLCEELGDLLLQIMLHARIADEQNEFDIGDVYRKITDKLIRRHPHVFGGQTVQDVQEVEMTWESLKQEERHEGESLLSGVPVEMPALTYSQSVQRRVASVGFDWNKADEVIDKLVEEVDEFRRAPSKDEKAREFGDLLFTLVNIARKMDIDAEMALRGANRRFYERFTFMEKLCKERGIVLSGLSIGEQDALWNKAKESGL
jgi:tetrapyrrole methylase family protein/MazG family protein